MNPQPSDESDHKTTVTWLCSLVLKTAESHGNAIKGEGTTSRWVGLGLSAEFKVPKFYFTVTPKV